VRVHARVEEEVFYPAYREAASKKEDLKLYFEAIEEHGVVDMVLPKLEETEPDAEDFAAKAKVLKDIIEHHAKEEEKEMFPRARKLFDADELAELGEQIEQRKVELMAELEGESGAPSGRARGRSSGERSGRGGERQEDDRPGSSSRSERGRGSRRGEGAIAETEVEVGAEPEE